MTILLPSGVKLTPKSDEVANQMLDLMSGAVVDSEPKSEEKTSRKKSTE